MILLDPRGVRFSAALTSLVLVLVLITGSAWLALVQAVVFGFTAYSPRTGPYAALFRSLVAPRLPPPEELEPAPPVQFAQLLGLVFTVVAAFGYLAGLPLLGAVMTGLALFAAFLNAAFGLCLGCQLYLAVRRLAGHPLPSRLPAAPSRTPARQE
jgi:hypothetical protein